MITKEEAVQTIADKITLSLSDVLTVKNVYDTLDLDALRAEEEARVTITDWKLGDRATTGKLYEDAHPKLKDGGAAYHVYIDGKQVYFQYDNILGGELNATTLADAKKAHLEKIVDGLMAKRIVDEIIKGI
jgi:hypothetical protein